MQTVKNCLGDHLIQPLGLSYKMLELIVLTAVLIVFIFMKFPEGGVPSF